MYIEARLIIEEEATLTAIRSSNALGMNSRTGEYADASKSSRDILLFYIRYERITTTVVAKWFDYIVL